MTDLFIFFFAFLAVFFAAMVVALRQPMRSALSLVGLMISLAAIYACLGAHVVAVFQVLIYVGAVMVFMVYTIMLLDERDRSYRKPFSRLAGAALLVAAAVAVAFWKLLEDIPSKAAEVSSDIFTFSAFSSEFMKHYWFHFELATVLLLVGILAAWTALKEGLDG